MCAVCVSNKRHANCAYSLRHKTHTGHHAPIITISVSVSTCHLFIPTRYKYVLCGCRHSQSIMLHYAMEIIPSHGSAPYTKKQNRISHKFFVDNFDTFFMRVNCIETVLWGGEYVRYDMFSCGLSNGCCFCVVCNVIDIITTPCPQIIAILRLYDTHTISTTKRRNSRHTAWPLGVCDARSRVHINYTPTCMRTMYKHVSCPAPFNACSARTFYLCSNYSAEERGSWLAHNCTTRKCPHGPRTRRA